jgi:hypothetical protein
MFNVSISGGLDKENTPVSKSEKFRTEKFIVTTAATCYLLSGSFYSSVSRNSVNVEKWNVIA